MNKKVRIIAFATLSVCLVALGFFIAEKQFRSTAERPIYWITIDEKELNHVQSAIQARGGEFNIELVETRGGLAIIKSDEEQILDLTRNMHDEFHKCAGFMSHESYEQASESINETLRADSNAKLVDYTINNQANVTPLISEPLETNVRQVITDLSAFPNRRHNQQSGLESATWIRNKWVQIANGRSDITVEYFAHQSPTNPDVFLTPQPSIILTVRGTSLPNEVVVLGAHQDSINGAGQTANAPGADDDASGVASLTEIIRVMVSKNFRPQRTIKFMAYAAEEVGLVGSKDIADKFQVAGTNVVGVLQLDMTNYKPASSNFDFAIFTDFTNAAQNTFLQNLITTYLPTMTYTTSACGYGCSDHASWHNKGYPASFPHESAFNISNPNIHKTTDTLAQSGNNANHAVKFTKLGLAYAGELAKGSIVTTVPNNTRMDYDGDGKTDVSVFRPSNGTWYLNRSTAGFTASAFGQNGDKIVPADYDGDGKTDLGVFREGNWYVLQSSNNAFRAVAFGSANDVPQPADFDGDVKADFAVFRPSNGTWYQLNSTTGFTAIGFGISTDKPVAADYDGDLKADVAVYRDGNWYILQSTAGFKAVNFGISTDKPVNGDFDGDNKADIAVYRGGVWYQQNSTTGFASVSFGNATDTPVFGDYDGDGKDDVGVFRNGNWYYLRSSNSSFGSDSFGVGSDIPTPSAY